MSNSTFLEEPENLLVQGPVTHQRVLIRKRVQKMLRALVPEISDRVFISRRKPLAAREFPMILIYTQNELGSDRLADNPIQDKHLVQLIISVGHFASSIDAPELQDRLDHFSEQIEQMMVDNPTLGGLVQDTIYASTDVEESDAGEGLMLWNKFIFVSTYYRDASLLVGGDSLLIGNVKYEIDDQNNFIEMEDEIDFEEEAA